MKFLSVSITVAALLCTQPATGQTLKVGLVLSGGGTKGGAHIGVLKALEEHNIEVSYVVGTSVGAIIGAMYAVGMSPDEIATAIAAIDWNDVLSDDPPRPTVPVQIKRDDFDYLVKPKLGFTKGRIELPLGIAQGQKVTRLLRQLLHASTTVQDFDNLTIPFRAVATSLETGEAVVLAKGDLPLSVRASMSLPGVFAPVKIDGQLLVDGGVAANLPINVARDMGAERIIAVDITSELLAHDQIKSLLTVTQQLIGIMTRRNVDAQVAQSHPQDIIIRPDVGGISTLEFAKTVDAIDPGYSAAYTHTIALQNLAEVAFRPGNLAHRSNIEAAPVIAFAEVGDNSGLSHQAVLARLNIDVGQAFDRRALDRSISRLYGTGLYQRIDYNLVERNGQTGLVVNAEAKAWGPDYLQFGLQLEEDFSADANFNIGVAFLQTGINPLGGQWRSQLDLGSRQGVHSEWYQPWNDAGRLFSRFRVGYERNNLRVFDPQGTALADLRIQELGASVSIGHQVGRASELEMSWQRLFGEAEELVGQVALTDNSFDVAELALAFRMDTLNRTARPSSGSLVRATALSSSRYTDGRDDYEQLHVIASRSMRLGAGQLSVVGIAGTTLDSNAPIQSNYVLGGLGRLSGHPVDRFLGQHIALLRGNVSRDFRSTAIPLFLGASLEAGNTWDTDFNDGPDNWITAGSIYGGFDTFLGPVYLAAGFAEGGQRSLYLSLGNPFAVKAIRPFD